jgi:hypothetical protein
MTEAKRQEIKDRITTAQARNAERDGQPLSEVLGEKAVAAKDNLTAFAREHPLATVAGGLAVGVLISAMFKNSPTRKAGRYAGARAAGLAALGTEMASAFAQSVMERTAGARDAGAELAEDAADKARSTARTIGETLARSLRKD